MLCSERDCNLEQVGAVDVKSLTERERAVVLNSAFCILIPPRSSAVVEFEYVIHLSRYKLSELSANLQQSLEAIAKS